MEERFLISLSYNELRSLFLDCLRTALRYDYPKDPTRQNYLTAEELEFRFKTPSKVLESLEKMGYLNPYVEDGKKFYSIDQLVIALQKRKGTSFQTVKSKNKEAKS